MDPRRVRRSACSGKYHDSAKATLLSLDRAVGVDAAQTRVEGDEPQTGWNELIPERVGRLHLQCRGETKLDVRRVVVEGDRADLRRLCRRRQLGRRGVLLDRHLYRQALLIGGPRA